MKQMYKVFLNERVIKFDAPENIRNNKSLVTFNDDCSAEVMRSWFNKFESSNMPQVILAHSNPDWLFMVFQSAFKIVHAAGGVVTSEDKILFIFRNGKWDLPKGKMNEGELAEEAAFREVEEETGIKPVSIDHRLPSTFHIYKSPYPDSLNQWIFKETFWFQMSSDGNPTGTPQQEEGISQVKWVAKTNLRKILSNTYENLKQVIVLYKE